MKERVRLMKCQNKKKNVKRAVAGIIFLSVIAIYYRHMALHKCMLLQRKKL